MTHFNKKKRKDRNGIYFHLYESLYICPSGKTANRGQCVTKYRASVRPAFIGGRGRQAEKSRWGEDREEGYCWRGYCEIGNGKQGGL